MWRVNTYDTQIGDREIIYKKKKNILKMTINIY